MQQDKDIAWNRKRVFLPVRTMFGVLDDGTSGVPASLGAGNPTFQESVAAAELAGMAIAAAGDEVYTLWPLPWDFDRVQLIRFRIWFSHSATDTDNPDWNIQYKAIAVGEAISDARSSGDETLTFAATAVSGTANALEILDWQESSSDLYITSTDVALQIAVECNGLGSASANEITLYGIELDYTVGATKDSIHRDVTRSAPRNSFN